MQTKVFKCGGKFFVSDIIKSYFEGLFLNLKEDNTLFVISAMKGMTRLLRLIFTIKTEIKIDEGLKDLMVDLCLKEFKKAHLDLIDQILEDNLKVKNEIKKIFNSLTETLDSYKSEQDKDYFYATVLQFGELASSFILNEYINYIGLSSTWFDARDFVITSKDKKEADILEIKSGYKDLFKKTNILVTQGFIGRTENGLNSVIGFDGSDYSATRFANSLALEGKVSLTFWKDVLGVYSANPKIDKKAKLISKMTRIEYTENTLKNNSFVVRPDSIAFLNKGIKTVIRSFVNLKEKGTEIT